MRNKEDALDVLQEATYKAYISIHQLNSPAYFSTWLVKILIRTAYKELEQKKKVIQLPEETIVTLLESSKSRILRLIYRRYFPSWTMITGMSLLCFIFMIYLFVQLPPY